MRNVKCPLFLVQWMLSKTSLIQSGQENRTSYTLYLLEENVPNQHLFVILKPVTATTFSAPRTSTLVQLFSDLGTHSKSYYYKSSNLIFCVNHQK